MNKEWLLLAALIAAPLATFGLANMVSRLEGPFSVFLLLRDKIGQASWVGRGLHCPVCVSFWAGMLVVALLFWAPWGQALVLAWGCFGLVAVMVRIGY